MLKSWRYALNDLNQDLSTEPNRNNKLVRKCVGTFCVVMKITFSSARSIKICIVVKLLIIHNRNRREGSLCKTSYPNCFFMDFFYAAFSLQTGMWLQFDKIPDKIEKNTYLPVFFYRWSVFPSFVWYELSVSAFSTRPTRSELYDSVICIGN